MKKIFLFWVLILFELLSLVNAQVEDDVTFQLRFVANSFREVGSNSNFGSVIGAFYDWETEDNLRDDNGQTVAVLRIKVENMALEDAKKLKATVSSGIANISHQFFNDATMELEVWCSPETFQIEVYGDGYKSRPENIRKLDSKHFYQITLTCLKQTTITIKTRPDDITLFLDGKLMENNQRKVSSGKHRVSFRRDGMSVHEDTIIVVSDDNYSFEFDLREKYTSRIVSDPTDANVYIFIDEKKHYFGTTPIDIELPEGSYRMITSKGPQLCDTTVLNVSAYNREYRVVLEQKKKIEFYAMYQGLRTSANIYIKRIDGGAYNTNPSEVEGMRRTFSLYLPYGKYEVRMSNDKNSSTRVIWVKENSNNTYEFTIKPPKRRIVWPWKREFEQKVAGLSIGYVQRSLDIKYPNSGGAQETLDPAWREDDAVTRGIRAGLHFQPCLSWGLGLYTGGFFEYYYSPTPSKNKNTSGNGTMAETFTSFTEMTVSVPLHLYYRMPFSESLAISFHGGIDAEYYFKATYKDKDGDFLTYTPPYGLTDDDDFMYKHFNLGYGFGVGIQWGWCLLEATWHSGITNHDVYSQRSPDTNHESVFSKFNVGFSILF